MADHLTDSVDPTTPAAPAAAPAPEALGWVDVATLTTASPAVPPEATVVAPDLLSEVPVRRRRGIILPIGVLAALAVGYVGATAFWPLDALPPTVTATKIGPVAPKVASMQWSKDGESAVGIAGNRTLVSSSEQIPMASITKIITVMTVLDHTPLKVGERGRTFTFTAQDSSNYWRYLERNESALDVPAGGTLTEYQLLEGIILGSAGNYTDLLAQSTWSTNEEFVTAARDWLRRNGIDGITIVEPTGIEYGNTATPEALIKLAQVAMKHPVVAEIAAKPSAEIPGAGRVENTNGIINDAGVVGLKTGSLEGFNLLSAKDLTVGGKPVQTYAVVLGQETPKARDAASRALYSQIETQLKPQPALVKGTKVADVTTPWGAKSTLQTTADAQVSTWLDVPALSRDLKLTDDLERGAKAGTLTATTTLDSTTVDVALSARLEGPSFWWRFTHPLEVFGLVPAGQG